MDIERIPIKKDDAPDVKAALLAAAAMLEEVAEDAAHMIEMCEFEEIEPNPRTVKRQRAARLAALIIERCVRDVEEKHLRPSTRIKYLADVRRHPGIDRG